MGLEAAMKIVEEEVNSMPREKLRHRLTFHHAAGIDPADPDGALRSVNIYQIRYDMEKEGKSERRFRRPRKEAREGRKGTTRGPVLRYNRRYWALGDLLERSVHQISPMEHRQHGLQRLGSEQRSVVLRSRHK